MFLLRLILRWKSRDLNGKPGVSGAKEWWMVLGGGWWEEEVANVSDAVYYRGFVCCGGKWRDLFRTIGTPLSN